MSELFVNRVKNINNILSLVEKYPGIKTRDLFNNSKLKYRNFVKYISFLRERDIIKNDKNGKYVFNYLTDKGGRIFFLINQIIKELSL